MKIGITGATGFVGKHLLAVVRNAGHDAIGFSRHPEPRAGFVEMRPWQPVRSADFSGLDAIVHLAGESISGVWTKKKRDAIRRSRVDDTCDLIARLRELPVPPRVLVSAGGVAYYGDGGEAELTEAAPCGRGFISEVARAWEESALEGRDFMRVVTLRTGLALGKDGGAIPVLRRVFGLGLGGRLGSGRQWMSWIHVTDLARLYLHAVESTPLSGPVNAVAPGPVRNAEFTRALAKVMHRPAFLPAPSFVLRMLPGEMSDVFLHSQRAVPAAAMASGFSFLYPDLTAALYETMGDSKSA
jgi:uncharacterized protein (TIGR01777 family)